LIDNFTESISSSSSGIDYNSFSNSLEKDLKKNNSPFKNVKYIQKILFFSPPKIAAKEIEEFIFFIFLILL
jgi:lipid A disaccharide synthetase